STSMGRICISFLLVKSIFTISTCCFTFKITFIGHMRHDAYNVSISVANVSLQTSINSANSLFNKDWNSNSGEDSNYDYHDHQFDESKAVLVVGLTESS